MKYSLLLLVGLLLASCGHTTRTLATWEREGLAPKQYNKLVVYVVAPTFATRSTMERTIAKEFSKKRLEAVAASDKLPDFKLDTATPYVAMQNALAPLNADLFLYVRHGNVVEGVTQEHGDLDPTGYGRVTLTRMESKLFNPIAKEVLMTIDTETNAGGKDNIEDMTETLASELIIQFKKKAIFFPKK